MKTRDINTQGTKDVLQTSGLVPSLHGIKGPFTSDTPIVQYFTFRLNASSKPNKKCTEIPISSACSERNDAFQVQNDSLLVTQMIRNVDEFTLNNLNLYARITNNRNELNNLKLIMGPLISLEMWLEDNNISFSLLSYILEGRN